MPYTPQGWASSPATSTPLTAARLAHIETQHAQALADVAADVSDSGSDIGAALSATMATSIADDSIDPDGSLIGSAFRRTMRPLGNKFVSTGDSISALAYESTLDAREGGGPTWPRMLSIISGQRMQLHAELATPGATVTDWLTIQVPAAIALSPRPNAATILIGANSVSTGFNLTTIAGQIDEGVRKLRAAGIFPILSLLVPRGAQGSPTATISPNTQRLNQWIRRYADTEGVALIDFYSPLVHLSGGITTAMNFDNTHPTRVGYEAMARAAVAQGIPDLFPPARLGLVRDSVDAYDMLGGTGLFAATTGWATTGTAVTITLPTPSGGDGIAGNWYQIARASSSTGDSLTSRSIALQGTVAGETIEVAARIQTTGYEATTARFEVSVTCVGSTDPIIVPLLSSHRIDVDGAIRKEFVVPAGTTSFTLNMYAKGTHTGATTLRFGAVTFRNVLKSAA